MGYLDVPIKKNDFEIGRPCLPRCSTTTHNSTTRALAELSILPAASRYTYTHICFEYVVIDYL